MEIEAGDTMLTAEEEGARPAVEIVVPVFNEERDLAASIRRLHAFVGSSFPFSTLVTIADNGSTDGTWALAAALAGSLPGVRALRIPSFILPPQSSDRADQTGGPGPQRQPEKTGNRPPGAAPNRRHSGH